MASFICCGFKRNPSPDPGPIRLVDNSQARGRFSLSTNSPTETSASSGEAAASVHKIFEAVASDEAQGGSFQVNSSANHETKRGIQREESIKNTHGIAERVRKTTSRDSGISKHSSKRNLQSSMSLGGTRRCRGLKPPPHSKMKSNPKNNKIDSDGEYDEDAVPMKTPRSTWGREQGATVEQSPRRFSRTLKRSSSPLPLSHSERDRQDFSSQAFAPRSATSTLSRMLTVRGLSIAAGSHDNENKNIDMKAEDSEPIESTTKQRYIFRDGSKSPQKPSTRTPSPLGRSDTVIRIPSSSEVVDLGQPTFLNTLGTHSTPDSSDILPQRNASISDSAAGQEWRLSYNPRHGSVDHPQFPETIANKDISHMVGEGPGRSIRATPEAWTRGASGLFKRPIHASKVQTDPSQYGDPKFEHRSHCSPANEEAGFGGVDGDDEGVVMDEFLKMQDPYARKQSSGNDSVHLYNMRIPQRLASQGLLQSVSQPYLQQFAASGEHILTDEYNFANAKLRRRVSSSGFHSGKVPLAWGLPKKYAASSVYSYERPQKYAASSLYSHDSSYITPAESHQGSMMFLNKIADRMNRFGPDAPARDIISVPAANNKHVDLSQMDQRTRDTSFHSSNESLTNRELAAAETRILPRAATMREIKSSWFKEDFDDVAEAIASTNPQRRTVSEKLNKKPSLSVYDGNMEQYLSIKVRGERSNFVAGGHNEIGTSVWEKALREHEEEDLAISRTRLGSDPMLNGGESFGARRRHNVVPNILPHCGNIINHFSPEHKQGEKLKAKLGAYRLPSPRRKPTPTDELEPVSAPDSFSSWTRYPSHDREQRSSTSAGVADSVFARDFADEAASAAGLTSQRTGHVDPLVPLPATRLFPGELEEKSNRKSRSMTFGRNAMVKLQKIYRAGSLEFASRTAFGSHGHRSSVSEGMSVEYPELEMLRPLSLPLSDCGKNTDHLKEAKSIPSLRPVTTVNHAELANLAEFSAAKAAQRIGGTPGARTWSRMYVENCVTYPTTPPPQASALSSGTAAGEVQDSGFPDFGLEEAVSVGGTESRGREKGEARPHDGSGSSESTSPNIRKSTLDFKESLEIDEKRARDKALGLTAGSGA